jgi:hypothetical protein
MSCERMYLFVTRNGDLASQIQPSLRPIRPEYLSTPKTSFRHAWPTTKFLRLSILIELGTNPYGDCLQEHKNGPWTAHVRPSPKEPPRSRPLGLVPMPSSARFKASEGDE